MTDTPKDDSAPKSNDPTPSLAPERKAWLGETGRAGDREFLDMSDFIKYEGTAFLITLPGHADVEFALDFVKPITGSNVPESLIRKALGDNIPQRQGFSLLFLGPQDMVFDQGCFDVTQKETGFKTNMFLVPIKGPYSKSDDEFRVFLQAVFN